MRPALAALLVLVATVAAGCLSGPEVPECNFPNRHVRVEVVGVDAALARAELHDARGFRAAACYVAPYADLAADGPRSAAGDTALAEVDQLWVVFESGLLRLGTNVTLDGSGTLEVQAQGPPVEAANLTWSGDPAPVRWLEWYDDRGALAPSKTSLGPHELENASGDLTLPVESPRNEGLVVEAEVDVNASRHRNWSAYDGSRQGVRVEVAVLAPNGSRVARVAWPPANGTGTARIDVPAQAAGNWTLRYEAERGEAQPGDLLYRAGATVSYGARPR